MSDHVLIDSSAWADYLRGRGRSGPEVLRLVAEDRVLTHPTVIGEVLLGGVDLADGRLGTLRVFPASPAEEVVAWLRRQDAAALRGVGWADCVVVHAALTAGAPLLTSNAAQRALYDALR